MSGILVRVENCLISNNTIINPSVRVRRLGFGVLDLIAAAVYSFRPCLDWIISSSIGTRYLENTMSLGWKLNSTAHLHQHEASNLSIFPSFCLLKSSNDSSFSGPTPKPAHDYVRATTQVYSRPGDRVHAGSGSDRAALVCRP